MKIFNIKNIFFCGWCTGKGYLPKAIIVLPCADFLKKGYELEAVWLVDVFNFYYLSKIIKALFKIRSQNARNP